MQANMQIELQVKELLERLSAEVTYSFGSNVRLSIDSIGLEGETLLHMVCLRGAMDDAAVLIAAGANVNSRNDMGQTPLHRAVYADSPRLVEMLLLAGSDPVAITNNGTTPKLFAEKLSNRNKDEIIELLEARHYSSG